MNILSSELSMEATTGHTDVTRLGVSQAKQSSNSPARFTLDLPNSFTRSSLSQKAAFSAASTVSASSDNEEQRCRIESQHQLANKLVETITGRRAQVGTASGRSSGEIISNDRYSGGSTRYYRVGNQPFKISLGLNASRVETESLQVRSSGKVTTEDGREIDFSLDLYMENRQAFQQISNGMLIDPIVLNFTSGLDMLEDEFAFSFDLDSDGENEDVCALNQGSGFLALDLNGDQTINNGSELFGPTSGSGYGELAEYDLDNNNWIDENDPIFEQLLVWMGGGSDNAELVSLKEAGVGAISLASVSGGQFSLKNGQGQVLATVDSTGVFLTEDGAVHSMQEIDLLAEEENDSNTEEDELAALESVDLAQMLRERLRQHRRRMLEALNQNEQDKLAAAKRESWLQERFWQWNDKLTEEETTTG